MQYTPTVIAARNQDEAALAALYEATQRDMYYLALKYVKNEDDAADVLQDAYIKAWQSLDDLQDPERFPAWLGRIVANTAKNLLAKRKPTLFSELDSTSDDGDSLQYDTPDDTIANQPELHYTQQETQQLVREMIDSLSDEQRLCILMFHLDGQSIHDIAETFGISENTVKSRLNYGRKALRKKAEALEKQGYKLYSFAPLPLLLLLLRQEKASSAITAAANAAKAASQQAILHGAAHSAASGTTAATGAASSTAAAGAKTAAAHTFFHTAAGKAIVALAAVAVIGGGTAAIWHATSQPAPAPTTQQEQQVEQTPQQEPTPEPQPEPEPAEQTLADNEYPEKIAGNLTKEELQYVLAYGPQEMTDGELADPVYAVVNMLCEPSSRNGGYIEDLGNTPDWRSMYSLSDLNHLFASFSDIVFTAENASMANATVEGDAIIFSPATVGHMITAEITSATYTDSEMRLRYHYSYLSGDGSGNGYEMDKEAILQRQDDGLYRITDIHEAPAETETQTDSTENPSDAGLASAYAGVLDAVAAKRSGYDFPSQDASTLTGEYGYFLQDLDQNGTPELIVGAQLTGNAFYYWVCHVYGYRDGAAVSLSEDFVTLSLLLPPDGKGLYLYDFSRGTGDESIHSLTLQNGTLQISSAATYHFTLGTAESDQFHSQAPYIEWLELSDRSALENLS